MSGGIEERPWWQEAVIYQIYPRSFQDTNGDGVGDLEGVRERLPYLAELGVDALWLSPIFPSPMADFGYDVADYRGIHPLFGDMAAFDALLQEAHGAGLKLLLDLVPNHSSDRHPWFQESRSSRDNPKRDWYIWRDPAPGGGPPNNWLSVFGGSAWEWDEASGQYYYHAFLKEQPDLNWRSPAVRTAMYDVLRFWFARGVDGFRIDVLWHLMKHAELPDNPPNPDYADGQPDDFRLLTRYSADQPEMDEIVREMRAVADEYDGRVLIGELYLPLRRLMRYYGEDGRGIHLPFNFHLIGTPWRAEAIAALVEEYEGLLPPGAWPNWVLGNHDRPRVATRIGAAQARVAAVLLLTLRGTPTLYQGDELGLEDAEVPAAAARDPQWLREPHNYNRDRVRTPMPWTADEPHAGFSKVEPWLPLTPDWRERNVESCRADEASVLALHRRLLALRREHAALRCGSYQTLHVGEAVFAYVREEGGESVEVWLNFGDTPRTIAGISSGDKILEASQGAGIEGRDICLPADGFLILRR